MADSKDRSLTKEERLQHILAIKKKQQKIKKQQDELKEAAKEEFNLQKEAVNTLKNDEAVKRREELKSILAQKEKQAEIEDEKLKLKETIFEATQKKAEQEKKAQHDTEMKRLQKKKEQNQRMQEIKEALANKKREKAIKDIEEHKKLRAEELNIDIEDEPIKPEINSIKISGETKEKPKVYIIAGPTAVGKSAIAIMLAKQIDGEIVNCDSIQIYKYLDIGSAKPTKEKMMKVPHHLYDFADPREQLTVAEYQKIALKTIDEIIRRGKTPIICGGTGLYLNSILYDMDFALKNENIERRKELERLGEKNGPNYLHEHLAAVDPETAQRIHPNNVRKVIRAIEAWELGSKIKPMNNCKPNTTYDFKFFGITMDREWLYDRINRRTLKLVKQGLIDEVSKLRDFGINSDVSSMKAIGYKEIYLYLDGKSSLKEAITDVMRNTRHYAKRQLTWLRRYDNITWIEIQKGDRLSNIVLQIINGGK